MFTIRFATVLVANVRAVFLSVRVRKRTAVKKYVVYQILYYVDSD